MPTRPPKRFLNFLRWFCRADCIEEIEGDLAQLFQRDVLHNRKIASWKFLWRVMKYVRPEFIKTPRLFNNVNRLAMFSHNFKMTYRNARKYKSAFLINLIGLSTGLASVVLIWLWVQDELSVDKFHRNDERLFKVWKNGPQGDGTIMTFDHTPALMARTMAEDLPEIELSVATIQRNPGIIEAIGKRFKAHHQFADRNFFNMFSYQLLHGSGEKVLNDKLGIVISEQIALKLFGTTDNVVGKSVSWEWRQKFDGNYIVTGVFRGPPLNSSSQFDVLFSYDQYLDITKDINWYSNNAQTYIMLREGTDPKAFNEKIRNYSRKTFEKLHGKDGVQWEGDVFIQPYSDQYLYGDFKEGALVGGRIEYVRLFSKVAIFILSIACINFMNLSTARASRRMKEVGIKKTIGAQRSSLVRQYLVESTLMVLVSMTLALCMVWLLLPFFSSITGKHFDLLSFRPQIWGPIALIGLITGLISGSYPAFYLSGFKPVAVLKGLSRSAMGEVWIRKGLVVFQFTISIVLIVSVIIVYKQIEFIQGKNLGYDRDNILLFENDGSLSRGKLGSFTTELQRLHGIVAVSNMNGDLVGNHSGGGGIEWEGKDQNIQFAGYYMDYGMIELLGLKMKAGRPFSVAHSDMGKVILNQKAIQMMNLKEPIGKLIKMWGQDREVVGIVNDFHYESLYNPVGPFFIVCTENNMSTLVRIRSGAEKETIVSINEIYQQFNPGLTFQYHFLDEDFERLYAAETRVSTLSKYFAVIAILISCLGLFGLAAFTAEKRTKEISIRKILGASEAMIIGILSGDFMRLITLSLVLGLPISFMLGRKWLDTFAYRIDLEWWFFIVAGFASFVIAFATITSQTMKAARISPIKNIKAE